MVARGSASQEPIPSLFQPAALESVKDDFPEIHALLCRVANFTKQKQNTGNWRLGEADTWTKFDPTTLSVWSSRIHHLLHRTIATATHETKLQFHYGPGLYRCDYILCSSNRLGFATTSARDAHVVRHERPFKCSKPECEFATIGFTSEKKRDDHRGSLHPELSAEQTVVSGIVISNDPMEASARLAQLVAAGCVVDVNALLRGYRNLAHEKDQSFLADLRRRVALSGSEPMCRLFFVDHGNLFSEPNWSEMTRLAIQGENDGAMMHLLSFFQGIHAVLASDSLWAFNILTATYGSDSNPAIDNTLVQSAQLTISVVQEARLVGFLANHRPFHALSIKDLTSILRNVVIGSRLHALSRFLVESGADPNPQRGSGRKSTPSVLHVTLRRAAPEAAEFAKFLLLAGADPYKTYTSTMKQSKGKKMLPGMELCAQNIQKWLGIAWDELVDWTQEERARRGKTVYRKLDQVEIEELSKI